MGINKKAKYIFWAVLYAVGQFYLTAVIFSFVEGNIFLATILNMGFVMLLVITEKMESYILEKICTEYDEPKKKNIFKRILLSYLTGPSAKSSLYFFYIVITICSALIAADPNFFNRIDINGFPFRDYLQSVRYGVLLLIAADKFLDQILKDIKQNKAIEDEN